MFEGQQCRERVPLIPSPANLKRAEQHKASIELAIYNGTFDYAATFPKSKRAARVGVRRGGVLERGGRGRQQADQNESRR